MEDCLGVGHTQEDMDSASNTFSATSSCSSDFQPLIEQPGQGIGNTVVWVLISPVPLGSSFPLIYMFRHEIQYVCFPGHGRRRPNGSLAEEFAVMEADMGECVTWNRSKQMPHFGWGLGVESSEMGELVRRIWGNGKKSTLRRSILFLSFTLAFRQHPGFFRRGCDHVGNRWPRGPHRDLPFTSTVHALRLGTDTSHSSAPGSNERNEPMCSFPSQAPWGSTVKVST